MTGSQPHATRPDSVNARQPALAPEPAAGVLSDPVMASTGRDDCHGHAGSGDQAAPVPGRTGALLGAAAARLIGEPVPLGPATPTVLVDPERLLTARQAAWWLGTSAATLGRWGRTGRLPVALNAEGVPLVGADGRPRFRVADVLALADRIAALTARAGVADADPPWVSDRRVRPPEAAADLALSLWGLPWHQLSRWRRRRAWELATDARQRADDVELPEGHE
jgi:hypothetical protein